MFVSTRKPEAIYKFIITSCKENIENDLKKKLKFEEFLFEELENVEIQFIDYDPSLLNLT